MDDYRCEALTKKGEQCKLRARVTIPNQTAGDGELILKNHRSAHLCRRHFKKKYPIKLIKNGILQHYNRHKYGNVIVNTILKWGEDGEATNKYNMPKFWQRED